MIHNKGKPFPEILARITMVSHLMLVLNSSATLYIYKGNKYYDKKNSTEPEDSEDLMSRENTEEDACTER